MLSKAVGLSAIETGTPETLIRQAAAERPNAAYYLVQTVLIQDLSLHIAQDRIAELEKNLALAEARPVQSATPSFLGGILTPNEPAPKPAVPAT